MKRNIAILGIIEKEIFEREKYNTGPDGSRVLPEFKIEDFIYMFEYADDFGKDKNVLQVNQAEACG